MMHCHHCGRTMTRSPSWSSRQQPWYCNGCDKTAGRCTCHPIQVNATVIEERKLFIEILEDLNSNHGCSDCGHGWPCVTRRTITEALERFAR